MGGTITFQEAERFGRCPVFSLMIKPVGSRCNMRCAYCYYLDKYFLYGGREPVMDVALLELCLRDYFSSCDAAELTVEWHGGEPLLAGLDFFRTAVELECRYSGGRTVHNTLQTNGSMLNREWASFFRDNDFLIGLSLDGPEDIHDCYRHLSSGEGSFRFVMRGLDILAGSGVEFNTLTAVSKAGEGRGADVYRFLKSVGSRYMQFMPVCEHISIEPEAGKSGYATRIAHPDADDSVLAPWSVSPEAFGRYLCDIFDVWVRGDVGEYFVLTFDAALSSWCGTSPGICVFCESCGGNIVVEHNGDIYPCDHFVYPGCRIGNVRTMSLMEAATSPFLMRFGLSKRLSLPEECLACQWKSACNGGCPKHRFAVGGDSGRHLNRLCAGYRIFYAHIAPAMDTMRDFLASGKAPSGICGCF